MLNSSEQIILTKADLGFLIGEMLTIGKDRYYWRAAFLKKCILQGWLSAEDARELWDCKVGEIEPTGAWEIWQESERLASASCSEM